MGDKTGISWCTATWNPTVGCTIVSPGCTSCYAMTVAHRLARMNTAGGEKYAGLTEESKAGPVWNGKIRLDPHSLGQPLRWTKPRMIFVNSMSDVFHDGLSMDDVDLIFGVMLAARQHTYQVLTKRADRMKDYVDTLMSRTLGRFAVPALLDHAAGIAERRQMPKLADALWKAAYSRAGTKWPVRNIWLGVSAEDQTRADERVPLLLQTNAAVRFVSAEPLIGRIQFRSIARPGGFDERLDSLTGKRFLLARDGEKTPMNIIDDPQTKLDWVIVGGESQPNVRAKARPMHPDWAREIRGDCAATDVAFFFKQVGHWASTYDRDRDDPDWRRTSLVAHEHPGGRWVNLAGGHGFHGARVLWMNPVGKKAAGELLDGEMHHHMPTIHNKMGLGS